MAPKTAAGNNHRQINHHHHQDWGYSALESPNTPDRWAELFPVGKLQSPIDIQLEERPHLLLSGRHKRRLNSLGDRPESPSSNSSGAEDTPHSPMRTLAGPPTGAPKRERQNTRRCATSRKLYVGYPRFLAHFELCNTGHSWQVSLAPEIAAHTLLAGPPLGDREYRLLQVHCHWGESCDRGSEHLLDGRPFSAEIHFVHWCCSHFRSAAEAAEQKHGLAVLAVLVQALEGDETNRNKHLEQVVGQLESVRGPSSSTRVEGARLDLKKLLPANRWHYASYEGSLTTPPLSEVVDWVVFLEPITCSRGQVERFRKLHSGRSGAAKMAHNCRPVQPHNGRQVNIWTRSHV